MFTDTTIYNYSGVWYPFYVPTSGAILGHKVTQGDRTPDLWIESLTLYTLSQTGISGMAKAAFIYASFASERRERRERAI